MKSKYIIGVSALFISSAFSQITFLNGGFEDVTFTTAPTANGVNQITPTVVTVSNWTRSGGQAGYLFAHTGAPGFTDLQTFFGAPTAGESRLDTVFGHTGNYSGGLKTLTAATATLTQSGVSGSLGMYEITVKYGVRNNNAGTLSAVVNGVVISSATFTNTDPRNGTITGVFYQPTAFTGGTIALQLDTLGDTTVAFDDVTITLVPEPSAALLGAFGALALLRRRRNA